jgi:predicted MFS family arabinose efflux permease
MPVNQSNTNFRLMAGGQIVTVLGSSLQRFALSLHVLDTTGRVDIFAALVAISGIPNLLASLGGAVSDRLDRRRLMVVYDAFCCAATFVFLFVLLSGRASILAVRTVMALLGFIGAMETPNGTACVPLLVPKSKLESANGIIQGAQPLSGIAAPALGSVLYGVFGIRALVAISGTAFGVAAVIEMFIRIPFERRPRSNGILQTLSMDLSINNIWQWLLVIALLFIPLAFIVTPVASGTGFWPPYKEIIHE